MAQAARYGFVWCPTDAIDRCIFRHPEQVFQSAAQQRRYVELTNHVRDWNAQLPLRNGRRWLAAKLGTLSSDLPSAPAVWLVLAAVGLVWRRPRGWPALAVLLVAGLLVLFVHALSQEPQSEFSIPLTPDVRARRSGSALRKAHRLGYGPGVVTALKLIPRKEFERAGDDLALLADMCRANALVAVKRAGSGHLGSSFSSLDIVAHLLWRELNVAELGWDDPNRDIFFSSKGHDVPGLYAALHALGEIPTERLLRLRRLGGLDGHPDIGVPGIEANSGSLGMGLSKGRGMAWAKRFLDRGGIVVVMTGDGELQEGQNWEALASAAHQRVGNLWAIVDRNELQSDRPTEEILALGDLEAKLRAFGSHVEVVRRARSRCARGRVCVDARGARRRAESPRREHDQGPRRVVHGAPAGASRRRRHLPLACGRARRRGVRARARRAGRPHRATPARTSSSKRFRRSRSASRSRASRSRAPGRASAVTDEYVAAAYGEELLQLVKRHPEVVVLDADLASDCRVRAVELEQPSRFVEVGIAEQDMVSMAAGLARQGLLPVVNSFASFLASRANEQIYNQASEGTKVVYALHYAGLIPAGPGKSHQSVRDISLLGSAAERHDRAACERRGDSARCCAGRSRTPKRPSRSVSRSGLHRARIELDGGLQPGRGSVLREGDGPTLLAYGPVLVHEALVAAEALAARGVDLRVVAMPWLNRFDAEWLEELGERRGRLRPRGSRPGGRSRRRAAPRARRPDAGDGVRRRGLAGVRNAARGAARARARRPVARGPHRARRVPRTKPVSDGRPVWLVLADPLSTRTLHRLRDRGAARRAATARACSPSSCSTARGGRLGFPLQRPRRALPA